MDLNLENNNLDEKKLDNIKYQILDMEAENEAGARETAESICQDLLANDLIETYKIIIEA